MMYGLPRPRRRFTEKDRNLFYSLQKGRCNACNAKKDIEDMDLDHKIPFSKGGSDRNSNLQMLCRRCNGLKGDGTQGQLMKKLAQTGIIKQESTRSTKQPAKKAKRNARKRDDPYGYLKWL